MYDFKYFSRRNFIKTSALSGSEILFTRKMTGNAIDKRDLRLSVPLQLPLDNYSILNSVELSPAKWIRYPMERCLANTVILFRKIIKLKRLKCLAHTVKGIIQFEMSGKKYNRVITITIPD